MTKHVVSTSLVVLYALLGAWVFGQLIFMFRGKHKRTGYKACFNYLTLLWSMMRSIFWLTFALEVPLPSTVFYLWFWLPQSIQFMTFSLLAMFLLKLLTKDQWRDGGWKARSMVALGGVALAHVVGSVIVASLASQDTARSAVYTNVQSLGSAVVFFVLSLVLAILGYRMYQRTASWETSRLMLFRFTPNGIAWITYAIASVFVSRSVFNFLSFAGVISIDIDQDDVRTDISAASVYGIWEFFPVLLLLSTLAAGPTGSRYGNSSGTSAGGGAALHELPTFGAFGALGTLDDGKDGSTVTHSLLASQVDGPALGVGLGLSKGKGMGMGHAGSRNELLRVDSMGMGMGSVNLSSAVGRGLGASGGLLLGTPGRGLGAGPGQAGSGYSLLGVALQGVSSRSGDALRGWATGGNSSALYLAGGAYRGGLNSQAEEEYEGEEEEEEAEEIDLQGQGGKESGVKGGQRAQGNATAAMAGPGSAGFNSGHGFSSNGSGMGGMDEDEVGGDLRAAAAVAMAGLPAFGASMSLFRTPTKLVPTGIGMGGIDMSPIATGGGGSNVPSPFSNATAGQQSGGAAYRNSGSFR